MQTAAQQLFAEENRKCSNPFKMFWKKTVTVFPSHPIPRQSAFSGAISKGAALLSGHVPEDHGARKTWQQRDGTGSGSC